MKTVFLISVLLLATNMSPAHATMDPQFPHGRLQPFTTDACTLWPDGTPEDPTKWQHCCVMHDLKYWAGGTLLDRLAADKDLRACVALTGEPAMGEIMFLGVRAGGEPFLPTPWRWGYGWPGIRGYTPLNESEIAEVSAITPADPLQTRIVKIGGH